jgi:hypothetical protein
MSSNIKMFLAKHPTEGEITAEDAELDFRLRNDLTCECCDVPITFVGTYIRKDTYVSHFFRLKSGMKTHREIKGDICKYEAKSNKNIKLPSSKIHGVIANKDLKIRINIPVELNKSIMDLLSDDLIPIKKPGQPRTKKAPGEYERSDIILSDYINSAKALAKIAREWEKDKDINYMEFTFFGLTAKWMDIYYENWDKLYDNFPTQYPKELIIMRGIYSSISRPIVDRFGHSWTEIVLKTTPITEKFSDKPKTFARIRLYTPMFRHFINQLESIDLKKEKVEITFFGKFERYLNKKDDKQNIKGIALLRKQIHFQIIKLK